jgi:CHAT domain-containing protein
VAVVGGPDIPDVEVELAAVADCYLDAEVRRGPEASAAATLELLGRADVVHLATHGRFRGDSPMFSSLALADGPLTVHDLEALPEAPRLVVLSACEVGRSDVRPGDEVQGVVSVLLGLGTSTLVASVLPVPHQLACDVTVAFHRRLVAGDRPAAALAAAAPPGALSPFLVFGSG